MPVPNSFANVTTSIPLSQLDANFNTPITLGNTAIQLGNTVTTLNNMTLANVTVTSGNVTITNVTVTTANVATANVTTSQILNYGTANQVQFLNASKALTGSANLTFDGTTLTPHTLTVSTGVLTVPAGSNTAPSITTLGDTNTGIFFPAADTVAIGTGGTEALRVNSSQNVGIGTSSPASRLHVNGTIRISGVSAGSTALYIPAGDIIGDVNSGSMAIGNLGDTSSETRITTRGFTAFRTGATDGTNGNERMRLDASGNFMVGGTTARGMLTIGGNPTRYFAVGDNGVVTLQFDDNGTPAFNLFNYGITGANQGYQLRWGLADAAANNAVAGSIAVQTDQAWTSASSTQDAYMQFAVALNGTNTERARITSGGDWLVGTTTNGGVGWTFEAVGYSITKKSGTATTVHISFQNNNGEVGKISTSGSATTYGTSSDYRLKENVAPMTGALAKVAAIKPCTYTWKVDGSEGEGFIAHELQEVAPYAVTGEKDGEQMQGVDYGKLTPILTAALQEAIAKIETLQARVAVLEAK